MKKMYRQIKMFCEGAIDIRSFYYLYKYNIDNVRRTITDVSIEEFNLRDIDMFGELFGNYRSRTSE